MNNKLRIGLLLDSILLPAWSYTAIAKMLRSNDAEVVLVVMDRSRASSQAQASLPWLYRVFMAFDEKLFLRSPNALAKVDASEILSEAVVMEATPLASDGEQYFAEEDVNKIRSHQLDVLVKIGFGKLGGDVLSAAAFGIWTYRWGDAAKIQDGLTGFWEVAREWPETGASLQRLGDHDACQRTLSESWFFTYPYSPARNRNYVLWAAASFLSRQVTRLHQFGSEKYFQERSEKSSANAWILESNDAPSNFEVLRIAVKLIYKNLMELFRRRFRPDRWELLFDTGPTAAKSLSSFNEISPPADRFWADPHIIYKDPNYYIFVEEYLYRSRRGHISVIEMDQQGKCGQSIPVLKENYHLSFPFVFDWMGRYYMIPESSENNTIDLYECLEFPRQWRHKLTLMKNVFAVDTVVIQAEGKWWLFTAIAEQQAAAPQVELFLFSSGELFTDQWHPHPMNPIISDVKKARAAGAVFIKDGRLFRPSQYGSSSYGHGFDLNEIIRLSETEYREQTVTVVRPESNPGIKATHTYAIQGNLTVVDALVHQLK